MKDDIYSKLHRWHIEKSYRDYKVLVVEPTEYNPMEHPNIFQSIIEKVILKEVKVDSLHKKSGFKFKTREYYDHIVFPEAFLPYDTFVKALRILLNVSEIGCIHVGLRPNTESSHLFTIENIADMLRKLEEIDEIVLDDLDVFKKWYEAQNENAYFNIACIFAVDQSNRLRLCLHPKLVRSKYESSPLQEKNMTEADMYCLVVLEPSTNKIPAVTIQPLICSDFIFAYEKDSTKPHPINGIYHDGVFQETIPDKIDIVSVVSLTKQQEERKPKTAVFRKWHSLFRSTFTAPLSNMHYSRYNLATHIISNYKKFKDYPGGLSGVFFPCNLKEEDCNNYSGDVHLHLYCSFKDGTEESWITREDFIQGASNAVVQRYILAISSANSSDASIAQAIKFTISRLPNYSGAYSLMKPGINSIDTIYINT